MIRLSNEQAMWLLDVFKAIDGAAEKLGVPTVGQQDRLGVADRINEQLAKPRHEQDLFEQIYTIITGASARVLLPGSILASLKAALLSPRELAASNALSKTWSQCSSCLKKIDDGEMMTMSSQQPVCIRCVYPDYLKCSKCAKLHSFPQTTLSKAINKVLGTCECLVTPNKVKDQMAGIIRDEPVVARRNNLEEDTRFLRNLADRGLIDAPTAAPRPRVIQTTGTDQFNQTLTWTTPPTTARMTVTELEAQRRLMMEEREGQIQTTTHPFWEPTPRVDEANPVPTPDEDEQPF